MRADGASFPAITAALAQAGIEISCVAVTGRHRWLTMTPEEREVRRALHLANRRAQEAAVVKERVERRVASPRPSPEQLYDRDQRLALSPRSLTAALLGDPLPGRSALDRRQPQ
jgi:hypothetical protein